MLVSREELFISITLSPVSLAAYGLISSTRGLSVRFPRFVRVREDKGVYDASTPEFLVRLWEIQERKGKSTKKANDDGDLVDADVDKEESEVDEYDDID